MCLYKRTTYEALGAIFLIVILLRFVTSYYVIMVILTSYVGLILRSTDVATVNQSTIEGTMRVVGSYCMCSSFSAFCHSSVRVSL